MAEPLPRTTRLELAVLSSQVRVSRRHIVMSISLKSFNVSALVLLRPLQPGLERWFA